MKLFVDDERNPPDDGWEIARNANDAIERLKSPQAHPITVLSLDHDLGENSGTGYDIASWLEKEVCLNRQNPPKILRVHSANPVGRRSIMFAFQTIVNFCSAMKMEVPTIEG